LDFVVGLNFVVVAHFVIQGLIGEEGKSRRGFPDVAMAKANGNGQSKHAPVKKSRGGTQPWPTSASAQHSTFAQAQRPMAGDAEEKLLTWGRRGNLQGPSTKPRTSPHPHRRGGSNAKRHNNDEGEEFLGPLVTAATTYAQIGQGLSLSLGYAAPFGSFGVHL